MSTYSNCSVKLAGSWKLLPGEPGVRKLIISIMVTGIWSGNAVTRELAGRTLLSGFCLFVFFFFPFGTGCQNQRTIKPSGALGFPLDSHLADLVQAAGHSVSLPLVHCLYNGSGSSRLVCGCACAHLLLGSLHPADVERYRTTAVIWAKRPEVAQAPVLSSYTSFCGIFILH